MIYSNLKNNEGMRIEGSLPEVINECTCLIGELYKKLTINYNDDEALGIIFGILKQASNNKRKDNNVRWQISLEEKLAYTQ